MATDGDERVLPLLEANLSANAAARAEADGRAAMGAEAARVAALQWGAATLPEAMEGAFDLVVACDALFDCRPPVVAGGRRAGVDEETAGQLARFFETAVRLLGH